MPLNTKLGIGRSMYTYYQFKNPSELISGKYASVVIPSTELPELPTVAIANWIDKLTQVFKEKFTEAAKLKMLNN